MSVDAARLRAAVAGELRRLRDFAKRNPLTIAGAILGLFVAGYVVHGLEGRIGEVRTDQQKVERRVVRISTCAASPHSQLCLQSVTRAVKRCLADPTCHNLIAEATVVVHHATGPRSSSPIPGDQSAGARGSPTAAAPAPSSEPPDESKAPPASTSPPPASGHQGGQDGSEAPSGSEDTQPPPETPAEAPQEAPTTAPAPEQAPPASTADVTPQKPPPAVSVCLGKLPCLEVPQLLPLR